VGFIYELTENTTRLIFDENLNKGSLTAQVMNKLLMCLNYMFMQYPDMQQPSLNTTDQQLHLKNHAKWTSRGRTRGVQANGPYIEPSGNFQKIPQIFQMTITH
jgi:hypothetical protein